MIVLDNMSFDNMSWDDDLVLICTSKEGLQRYLAKQRGFGTKFVFEINASKANNEVLSKSLPAKTSDMETEISSVRDP